MKIQVCKLDSIKLLDGKVHTIEELKEKGCIEPILPTYGTLNDACMDVYPIYFEYDFENDRYIYHTGLAFAIGGIETMRDDYIPNEMVLRPRSNLTKSEFYMPNAPGTLDWGYRGELLIILKNRTSRKFVETLDLFGDGLSLMCKSLKGVIPTDYHKSLIDAGRSHIKAIRNSLFIPPYTCDGKSRCCQLIIGPSERIEWEEVKSVTELGETERGEKGFGQATGGTAKA